MWSSAFFRPPIYSVLQSVRNGLGPVGPQIGHVARLAEVQFDGNVVAVHVNVAEAGAHHETGQLLLKILPPTGAAEVREINLGCHVLSSPYAVIVPIFLKHRYYKT